MEVTDLYILELGEDLGCHHKLNLPNIHHLKSIRQGRSPNMDSPQSKDRQRRLESILDQIYTDTGDVIDLCRGHSILLAGPLFPNDS